MIYRPEKVDISDEEAGSLSQIHKSSGSLS